MFRFVCHKISLTRFIIAKTSDFAKKPMARKRKILEVKPKTAEKKTKTVLDRAEAVSTN